MQLAIPAINIPGPTPAVPGASFRNHAVTAFDLTTSVIESLTQPSSFVNAMSSGSNATMQAQVALREIGLALQDTTAPTAGVVAARSAQQLLTTGTNELLHPINGQVPLDIIVGNFTAAQAQLQIALDSTGAAHSR